MIALAADCLLFQMGSGETIPFSAEMISVEVSGEHAHLLDPEAVQHAASAVFHYFKHEEKRETVLVSEFAEALAKRWEPFAKNKKLGPRIKTMIQDLYRLTRLYNLQMFSPFEITREEHRQAVQSWSRIRRGLGRLSRW